jgi:hypothetical protein
VQAESKRKREGEKKRPDDESSRTSQHWERDDEYNYIYGWRTRQIRAINHDGKEKSS